MEKTPQTQQRPWGVWGCPHHGPPVWSPGVTFPSLRSYLITWLCNKKYLHHLKSTLLGPLPTTPSALPSPDGVPKCPGGTVGWGNGGGALSDWKHSGPGQNLPLSQTKKKSQPHSPHRKDHGGFFKQRKSDIYSAVRCPSLRFVHGHKRQACQQVGDTPSAMAAK